MPVPNTTTFTLANVCDEIGLIGSARTLSNCFASANSSGFNLTYGNINDDDLLAFRDYDHSGGGITPSLTISPTSLTPSANAGFNSFSVTSNTTWNVTYSQSWVSGTNSGSGNGTVSFFYDSNGTGSPRSATIIVTTTSGSPSVSRTYSITQASGFE